MFYVEHFETKTREGTAGFYPPVPSRVFAAAKGGAKTKTVAHRAKMTGKARDTQKSPTGDLNCSPYDDSVLLLSLSLIGGAHHRSL